MRHSCKELRKLGEKKGGRDGCCAGWFWPLFSSHWQQWRTKNKIMALLPKSDLSLAMKFIFLLMHTFWLPFSKDFFLFSFLHSNSTLALEVETVSPKIDEFRCIWISSSEGETLICRATSHGRKQSAFLEVIGKKVHPISQAGGIACSESMGS